MNWIRDFAIVIASCAFYGFAFQGVVRLLKVIELEHVILASLPIYIIFVFIFLFSWVRFSFIFISNKDVRFGLISGILLTTLFLSSGSIASFNFYEKSIFWSSIAAAAFLLFRALFRKS